MQTVHRLFQYAKGKWDVDEAPQTRLVSELLANYAYFYLVVEDLNGQHALTRTELDNCLPTDTIQQAADKLVFNRPVESIELSKSALKDIHNVKLVNGVVFIDDVNPLVFNTTTSFLTQPYNGGSLVIDYLDNVEATNDVTLGCFNNLAGFEVIQLGNLTMAQIDASLLKINNVLVKTTDYFKSLGNDVIVKPHKAEALMSLLVEARLSPRDIGIVGNYTAGVFKSRLVCSRLIKHPDVVALVNPSLEPVQLEKFVLPKSLALPCDDVVYIGNRPTTHKALAMHEITEKVPTIVSSTGVCLQSEVSDLCRAYQVQVVYPRVVLRETI